MNDPLLGPRIKLDRAAHHLVELERAERRFFERNSCKLVFDTETQPGHKLVKIVLDARPPEILHVLTGEFLYQLRSALDQTAVAFARLSKGVRGRKPNPRHVYFPTGDSAKGFRADCGRFDKNRRLVGNLRWFDSDLRKAILRTKPYDGGNDALRAVFPMANIDKHMELIAMSTAAEAISVFGSVTITNAYTGLVASLGDLNQGVVISDLRPDGTFEISDPKPNIYVSGRITLGGATRYAGRPLLQFLRSMIEAVRKSHADFENLLISRGDMTPMMTTTTQNCVSWGFKYRAGR